MWTIDDFEIGACVGTGRFGKVYLAREKRSKTIVAIKCVTKKEILRSGVIDLIQNEIDVQSHLQHKNIIGVYGYFWDDVNIYVIMEYGYKGDLKKYIDKNGVLPEIKAAKIVKRIAEAVQFMESKHVMHRDIKPENILIGENDEPKLTDFGCAVRSSLNRITLCGTPSYISPEIADSQEYSDLVDIWALGILTYELCTGKPPYEGETIFEVKRHINNANIEYPITMTAYCQDFISKILVTDPQKRPSIEDILSHEWLNMKE